MHLVIHLTFTYRSSCRQYSEEFRVKRSKNAPQDSEVTLILTFSFP